MKNYLAVFTHSPDSMTAWDKLPEGERKQREADGMAGWKKWVDDYAPIIHEMGGPLSRTTRISASGVAEVHNNLSAFCIVQAESREAAAKLFLDHPHFMIFPGDGVEVMEVLPVPGG